MCNSYCLRRNRNEDPDTAPRWLRSLPGKGKLPALVRPTAQAPVVLSEAEGKMMRWGFQRPWAATINNTRTDKLNSPVWRRAFEMRRCLIPMSGFYEYTGPAGRKQAHLFTPPPESPEEWLWAAGIWEAHAELGDCYSMLMREAAGVVKPIHDRMPVLVSWSNGGRYLAGDFMDLNFAPVPLTVASVENPLKKSAVRPAQGNLDLFSQESS